MSTQVANEHNARMEQLIEFTESSLASDYPSPFGSSIYNATTGKRVAEAYDTVLRDSDPTSHGEVNAIRMATRKLETLSLQGHILYSTCEPCPMCMSACIWAELDAIVYGASTHEDAHQYWPQSSDVNPMELAQRMLRQPKIVVIPHVQRGLCQHLFMKCDQVRRERALVLPPHRLD